MKSAGHGTPISGVEVTNISQHGFWLLLRDQEYFLPFEHFPWFKEASVSQICKVELQAVIISTGRCSTSIWRWSPSSIPSGFRWSAELSNQALQHGPAKADRSWLLDCGDEF